MSRWKMNKLGFLNFWLYDQEEFPIQDGHILTSTTAIINTSWDIRVRRI